MCVIYFYDLDGSDRRSKENGMYHDADKAF